MLELLQLKAKESFIENKLSQDINLVKKIYATIGFNFANVEAKIEKFDIENNEDYYLLLRSNDNNKYYDISSNIFKIKYFDDCEKFPFGRFNNSKTNLKLYPFLDSGMIYFYSSNF